MKTIRFIGLLLLAGLCAGVHRTHSADVGIETQEFKARENIVYMTVALVEVMDAYNKFANSLPHRHGLNPEELTQAFLKTNPVNLMAVKNFIAEASSLMQKRSVTDQDNFPTFVLDALTSFSQSR